VVRQERCSVCDDPCRKGQRGGERVVVFRRETQPASEDEAPHVMDDYEYPFKRPRRMDTWRTAKTRLGCQMSLTLWPLATFLQMKEWRTMILWSIFVYNTAATFCFSVSVYGWWWLPRASCRVWRGGVAWTGRSNLICRPWRRSRLSPRRQMTNFAYSDVVVTVSAKSVAVYSVRYYGPCFCE
jgi:hypothetical protein